MKFKTWVRAALLVAALGAVVIMAPIDWCKVEGVCGAWFEFLCPECPPTPPG